VGSLGVASAEGAVELEVEGCRDEARLALALARTSRLRAFSV
jgi:hypothetical protein